MDTIKQAFSTDDAARILSIPLSSRQLEDCLIWAFTPKGNFTVRSAYKVALSAVSSPNAGTSDGHNCKSIWKSLWHLSVPNKIKSFAQRASKNILPTKANLFHRKVIDNPTCEACGLEVESSGHLFRNCEKTRSIWELSGLPLDMNGLRFQEFIDF